MAPAALPALAHSASATGVRWLAGEGDPDQARDPSFQAGDPGVWGRDPDPRSSTLTHQEQALDVVSPDAVDGAEHWPLQHCAHTLTLTRQARQNQCLDHLWVVRGAQLGLSPL